MLRHVVRTIREKEGSIAFLKSSSLAVGIAIARRGTDNVAGEEIRRVLAHLVENSYICDDLKSQLNDLNGRNCSASRSRIYSVNSMQGGIIYLKVLLQIATERARISSDSSCIHWLYKEILKSVLDASDVLAQLDALDTFVDIALNGKQNAETLFKLNIVKQVRNIQFELIEQFI